MGKPGFGIFQGRRKSSGNVLEDADPSAYLSASPVTTSPSTEQGGFRVLNRSEIEKAKQEKQEQVTKKAHEKGSKLGRFSFGTSGNKAKPQSVDEDSPSSSKRYVIKLTAHNPVVVLLNYAQRQQVQQRNAVFHVTAVPRWTLWWV